MVRISKQIIRLKASLESKLKHCLLDAKLDSIELTMIDLFRGSFASVRRGRSRTTGDKVAIKVISK